MRSPVVIEMPSTMDSPPGSCLARLVRVDDWSTAIGGQAYVVKAGRVIRVGVIELATSDDSVAWVAQSGAEARQLISKADNHELWVAPRQLQRRDEGGWQ